MRATQLRHFRGGSFKGIGKSRTGHQQKKDKQQTAVLLGDFAVGAVFEESGVAYCRTFSHSI